MKPLAKASALLCTMALAIGMVPVAAFAEDTAEPEVPIESLEAPAPDTATPPGDSPESADQAVEALSDSAELAAAGTVTVYLANGDPKTTASLTEALAWANGSDYNVTKLELSAGTFEAEANEGFRVTKPGLIIEGKGSDQTIIDCESFAPSGQSGFLIQADNVSLSNLKIVSKGKFNNDGITALKFTAIGDGIALPILQGGSVTNVVLESEYGHGVMLHGVNKLALNGVTVGKFGKCAIGIANSSGITVSNTTTVVGGWGADIGFMYKNDVSYRGASTVAVGTGNTFANGMVYSERPASAAVGTDTITGLDWTKCVSYKSSVENGWAIVQSLQAQFRDAATGVSYATLADACAFAADGATLTMCADINDATSIPASMTNKSLTIKGAGYTFKAGLNTAAAMKSLTLDGVKFTGKPLDFRQTINQATVTNCIFDNCEAQSNKTGAFNLVAEDTKLTFTNNTVSNVKKAEDTEEATGMYIQNCSDTVISGNTFTNIPGTCINPNTHKGSLTISGNTFKDWAKGSTGNAGRAIRIDISDGDYPISITHNAMIKNDFSSTVNESLIKISGAGLNSAIDASYNFWAGNPSNGNNPETTDTVDGKKIAELSDTGAGVTYNLYPYYVDSKLTILKYGKDVPPIDEKKDIENQIKDLPANPTKEQVNTVVNHVVDASQATKDNMVTADDAKNIKTLEDLYRDKNSGSVGETDISAKGSHVNAADVSGAALSVPLTGTQLYAQLAINEIDPSELDLPADVNWDEESLVALDIVLNIFSKDGVEPVSTEIQPKAPITVTLKLKDENGKYANPDQVLLYHYHGTGQEMKVTALRPISRSYDQENKELTISFTLSKLSKVLVGMSSQVLSVDADDVVVDYDGNSHTVAPVAKIGDKVVADATITYWDGQAYTKKEAPTFTDVTETPATVKFQAFVEGVGTAENTATVTVNKAKVTVSVKGATATKTFTGKKLEINGYSYTADNKVIATVYLNDGFKDHAEGTAVGTYSMGLSDKSFGYTLVPTANPDNYDVTLKVVEDGYLKIVAAGGGGGGGGGTGGGLAKTGDVMLNGIIPLAVVGLAAGAALCVVALYRRSRQK